MKGLILSYASRLLGLTFNDISHLRSAYRQARVSNRLQRKYFHILQDNNKAKPIVRGRPTVWQFWDDGLKNAPEMVKFCSASVKKHTEGIMDYKMLDLKTVNEVTNIPGYVYDKYFAGKILKAHFSDIVRVNILVNHGGIWCDGTVFLTQAIPDYFLESNLFLFSTPTHSMQGNPYIRNSNWFIYSNGSKSIELTNQFLLEYWRGADKIQEYFIFHIFQNLLFLNNQVCKEEFQNIPYVSHIYPHLLQDRLHLKFNHKIYSYITNLSSVHKLSHYGIPEDHKNTESYYSWIFKK